MDHNDTQHTTHFGYKQVAESEKQSKVTAVFDSVASQYDLMNDLMSMGIHRIWKRKTIEQSGVKSHHKILDLAGGTGDLAKEFSNMTNANGQVILADINAAMLECGRDKLIDQGIISPIQYVQADAECLPFKDNYFDRITMAFGLRNVTHKEQALKSIFRVLKPGGKFLILEFSHPDNQLFKKIYDQYSFKLLPVLGKLIANDSDSYQYLAESIRMHPNQETLMSMMQQAGFEKCQYINMTSGIVALHSGYKF
ncbi:MAG: bifunctional demethylmenaquinone methyltransferase/2-methoxy-6-polyprenyl-1,4-benzoquinol methylase UbiE [Methylococcales bacterium]|jgi:demethylmenaquinone methyltransferase/2-methoxy-6-polyprenyl-1,4-benzoquinol methylase|nr:bifunctional demethylmenaquinone methyltransferase/2-methoxy-6-polyprenyl-1,4-benzoquinol methylase UbiE [Methylococcales bacterium]MBT7410481.1 bifunctional demethylmenaquinone methyltransferase/2-methoxy-6-polyprenyl-1,4-benzoquinol methylase UbiE [Methylococcales bacterium]